MNYKQMIFDDLIEITKAPKDNLAMLQADQTFLQRIVDRLTQGELIDRKRVWLGREEIRNLRRLVGMNTSNQYLARLRNRRMRVSVVRQFVNQAEERLTTRAAALVTEKLMPKPEPAVWPNYDVALSAKWSSTQWAQAVLRAYGCCP